MVAAITIRNVPDDVRQELAARAARSGRSLQEYLIAELRAIALRPTCDDVIARARARVDGSDGHVTLSDILDARDSDRR